MKVLSVALAAASTAALVLIGAAPAIAAGNSIDPGDSLYAISCNSGSYNQWQLLGVIPETAAATTIGTGDGTEGKGCGAQPAYDATTGKSYYIQWTSTDEGSFTTLVEIDTITGVSTTIGEFHYVDGEIPVTPDVISMAIGTDGAAYAIAQSDGAELFSVDLTTALVTPIDSTLNDIFSFAVNPVTGDFYVINEDGELFSYDVATGDGVSIGSVPIETEDQGLYSLQIDGGGTFWVEIDDDSDSRGGLWSFTLDTFATPVFSGHFIDDPFYTEALLIVPGVVPPKPQLAATGVDAGLGLGVAGFLALAGLLLVVRRNHRTA
jgi:hypothetical protein